MKRIVFILALALFSFQSYAQSTGIPLKKPVKIDQTQYLEVFINAKGKIYVNGKKTKLKDVDPLLSDLKQKNGYVRLAREGKNNSKKGMTALDEVSKLIKKYGRMIRIYSDKNFTKEVTL